MADGVELARAVTSQRRASAGIWTGNLVGSISNWNASVPGAFFRMSSDRAIVDAIKVARTLLSQNLPPAYNLPDAATVTRVRELVHSPSIRSALERSSDTLLAFALRAVERVVADQSLTNRQIITRLWDVLDDPPSFWDPTELPHDARAIPQEDVGPRTPVRYLVFTCPLASRPMCKAFKPFGRRR